ncbi:extracellular solute-binding protein [Saccharibacillus sp. CPCC 101409]|uniref:extracellular solute-binding protein n=1 Tax=Saccharibacillus sp. CPCC 101409 TaxID=3058041 RepID=UPI002673E2A5|nr:extracellular solute-binding protein [Saccharibacillus sp. CPCC 101409]MDO3409194.1 extracellular solute-binding protein [Saccharibacillus sp. CPCC 101409]
MKRKNVFVLFGVLLLALINLSPSLPEASTPKRTGEPGHSSAGPGGREAERPLRDIEVYTMMEPSEFAALKQLNERYEQRSGTKVELKNIPPGRAYKAYKEAYAAGREPDVLMLDSGWVARLAASGSLLPADLYGGGGAAASDSLGLPASAVEWNGYRWAVPLDLDPYAAAWNPDKFASDAGALPSENEAWEKWEEGLEGKPAEQEAGSATGAEARQTAAADSADGSLIGLPGGDGRAFAALLALWGATFADGADEPTVQAIERADRLRGRTYVADSTDSNLLAKAESGELSLVIDRLSNLEKAERSAVRTAPLPAAAAGTAAMRSLGIAADTQHAREASLWIAYITGGESQEDWFELTGHLSALRGVYDDSQRAELLRWLPDADSGRNSAGAAAAAAESKKIAARQNAWARSFGSFYEGKLDVEGLTEALFP